MFISNRNLDTVLLFLADTLCFHIRAEYMFFLLEAGFFFRRQLAVLLPHKGIFVEGFPCNVNITYLLYKVKHYLGISLLKTHLLNVQDLTLHLSHNFFLFSLPFSLLFPITVQAYELQGFSAFNPEPYTDYSIQGATLTLTASNFFTGDSKVEGGLC